MNNDIDRINELVIKEYIFVEKIFNELSKVIIGQKHMLERLIIGVLANGHVLLEGVPGLAKTLSVKSLAETMGIKFQRIQFTPDLLPADLIGTMIYNPQTTSFTTKKGPIFANIILADEINRAPSKVQSALLEAMQERQVTIADNTFQLDDPFLVLATQNPIEQGGTYPLPEAQVDRFMLKVKIDYPAKEEEKIILDKMSRHSVPKVSPIVTIDELLKAREIADMVYVDEKIKEYIIDIVFASREPEKYNIEDLDSLILYGASPRATIALTKAAKVMAFLRGRGYVIPDDIKEIGYDILRHRIIISYEAEAEDMTSEDIINKIFNAVPIP